MTNDHVKWHSDVTAWAEQFTGLIPKSETGGRQTERGGGGGGGVFLLQKTLSDATRVDEAGRSIWHNYCARAVIDEHVDLEDFLWTKPHRPISAQSKRLNRVC